MSKQIINYNEVWRFGLTLHASGLIYCDYSPYFWSSTTVNGKIAYFEDDENQSPAKAFHEIESNVVSSINPYTHKTIYVSQKAKVPRDILRNSGYKIILDPKKADCAVIPNVKDEFHNSTFKALAYEETMKRLYLIEVDTRRLFSSYNTEKVDETKILESLDEYIINTVNQKDTVTIYHYSNLKPIYVQFLPKVNEYIEILSGNKNACAYVFEKNVQTVPAVNISVDTLLTWKMCKDVDMLQKAILNSDYKDYPFTVAMFLHAHKRNALYYSSNQQFKRVLDEIGYDDLDYCIADYKYSITDKDFNMLQKWLMYCAGVDEKGGWADINTLKNLDSDYIRLIMRRIAIKPYSFEGTRTVEQLIAETGNN